VGTPYLAQYDAAGNLLWQHNSTAQIGREGVGVAADAQGNIFQVVSAGADGTPTSLNAYDPAGALRWTTYVSPGEHIFSVAVDDLGYAYASSYISSGFVFVRKFDGATGEILWNTPIATGGTNNSTGVSADRLGNIYVAAYTNGSLLGPNAGGYDSLLIKLSDAGDVLWTRQFGTPQMDLGFIVSTDGFGNAYLSGQTMGSLGGPSAGDQDNFLAKYDAAGNQLWIRQFGTSGQDSISTSWIDSAGNVYQAMHTRGALGGAHQGESDIVVVKYDPWGNIRWATQIGTIAADGAGGGVWGDAAGNLYVAGATRGSLGGPNAGGADAVLIKLSSPALVAAAESAALSTGDDRSLSPAAVDAAMAYLQSAEAPASRQFRIGVRKQAK
jgi:hypothetical protein